MNKKGKTNTIAVVAILAIAALAVYFLFFSNGMIPTSKGDIVNGYWDEATQECRSKADRPNSKTYIPGQIGVSFGQCCFDQQKRQVDCNDPSKLWGAGSFAIYEGLPGTFFVSHFVTITNTGNVDLTNAWIETATWSPAHASITNAYATVVGSGNGIAIAQGAAKDWSTGLIDLQAIGGSPGSPITYALSLTTKASATGLPDASEVTPSSMIVEQEGIGFSVEINLGA